MGSWKLSKESYRPLPCKLNQIKFYLKFDLIKGNQIKLNSNMLSKGGCHPFYPGNSNSNVKHFPLNDSYWSCSLEYSWDVWRLFADCSKETLVTSTSTGVCEVHREKSEGRLFSVYLLTLQEKRIQYVFNLDLTFAYILLHFHLQKPPLHVAGIPFTENRDL